jgi:hypothetical protein
VWARTPWGTNVFKKGPAELAVALGAVRECRDGFGHRESLHQVVSFRCPTSLDADFFVSRDNARASVEKKARGTERHSETLRPGSALFLAKDACFVLSVLRLHTDMFM